MQPSEGLRDPLFGLSVGPTREGWTPGGALRTILLSHRYRARGEYDIELQEISRFRTWTPPFSAPPMIQVGNVSAGSFELRLSRHPYPKAPIESVEAHYTVVFDAWERTKAQTPTA